jgi:hypothetical protein
MDVRSCRPRSCSRKKTTVALNCWRLSGTGHAPVKGRYNVSYVGSYRALRLPNVSVLPSSPCPFPFLASGPRWVLRAALPRAQHRPSTPSTPLSKPRALTRSTRLLTSEMSTLPRAASRPRSDKALNTSFLLPCPTEKTPSRASSPRAPTLSRSSRLWATSPRPARPGEACLAVQSPDLELLT